MNNSVKGMLIITALLSGQHDAANWQQIDIPQSEGWQVVQRVVPKTITQVTWKVGDSLKNRDFYRWEVLRENYICSSWVYSDQYTDPLNQLLLNPCIRRVRELLWYGNIPPIYIPNNLNNLTNPPRVFSPQYSPNLIPWRFCSPLSISPSVPSIPNPKGNQLPSTPKIPGYLCQ